MSDLPEVYVDATCGDCGHEGRYLVHANRFSSLWECHQCPEHVWANRLHD